MLAMVAIGVLLLALILSQTDLAQVAELLARVGPLGALGLLLVFALSFLGEGATWLWALPGVPLNTRWLGRFCGVALAGQALEYVTPLAGLGGEPMKAMVMKRHYGVPYRDASASLVVTRMTDLVAQILFMAVGLALMWRASLLPLGYRIGALAGLCLFAAAIAVFIALQYFRGFSKLRAWAERGALGERLGARAVSALDAVNDVEGKLSHYYTNERKRFVLSTLAALWSWIIGSLAGWWALALLGHPVSFADALVIEAFMMLVRSVLFFVPADLGTQDGALVLIVAAITGIPSVGVAYAAIRRARDLAFVAAGMALGAHYSVRDVEADPV